MKMKPKTRAMLLVDSIIVVIVAILCSNQQASSWQLIEPFGLPAGQHQQQQMSQQLSAASFPFQSAPSMGDLRPSQNEAPPKEIQQSVPAPSSTAGKILDSLVSNTIVAVATATKEANSNSSNLKAADGNKSATFVSNILKPRKSSDKATKDIEQQIIQQHARVHQFLTPSKKFASSQSFAESDGRDSSALSSILDNFKSGITSRSSIVKAISDNKLARTLTDVGKTIGSNKYVAGAAAASALAALGLAVSKLITPYVFAGGFSGPETLMPSGSSLAESYAGINPSRLSSFGEYAGAVSSSPSLDYSPSYPSNNQQFSAYGPDTSRGQYLDTAGSSAQPTYYTPGIYIPSSVLGPDGRQQKFFVTYTQKPSPQSAEPIQRQQPQQAHIQIQSDVNGHYTPYYDNQPIDSSGNQQSQTGPMSVYNEQPSTLSYQQPTYTYNSNNNNNNQQDFMSTGDQMPSASVEMASYATQQPGSFNQLSGRSPTRLPSASRSSQTGRRYGAVSLKLKSTAKDRITKSNKQEIDLQQPARYANFVGRENLNHYPHAGDKSVLVPQSTDADQSGESTAAVDYLLQQRQQQQQRPQVSPMIPSTSDKDQGHQVTLQANNNNGAFRIIRPIMGRQTARGDKLGAESSSSSASPWISIPLQPKQQLLVGGQNSIDHQGAGSSFANQAAGQQHQQLDRVFRTPTPTTTTTTATATTTTTNGFKGLDYGSPAQVDTFESRDSGENGVGKQATFNDNVIRPVEATTKSGKLATGQQTLKQQQAGGSQLDNSSSSSSSSMSDSQDILEAVSSQSYNGQDSKANDRSSGGELFSMENERSNIEQAQRRGQPTASSSQGNSGNEELS